MLELIFVIVVLGILAALAIPRLDRDLKQEAADNILSAIRYTQHLALVDDRHKFDDAKWQQRFWHIYFGTCDGKTYYAIGSDDSMDTSTNARVDFTESIIDPSNGKHIWGHDGSSCNGSHNINEISPNIFIGKKYGIKSYQLSGDCTHSYIGFDHFGRPYGSGFPNSSTPNNSGAITQNSCIMTFTLSDDDTFSITVEPETGYAYISNQAGS